jgi:hypothetical protein
MPTEHVVVVVVFDGMKLLDVAYRDRFRSTARS